MKELFTLLRIYESEATLGTILNSSGKPLFKTLEPPKRNNAKDNPNTAENEAGCIPEGIYQVKKRDPKIYAKARFKDNWEILKVPNKSGVVIHAGNYWWHSQSCILIGRSIRNMNPRNDPKIKPENKWFLSQSKDALAEFYKTMPEEFILEIKV